MLAWIHNCRLICTEVLSNLFKGLKTWKWSKKWEILVVTRLGVLWLIPWKLWKLLKLNPGVLEKHLATQLLWAAAWLLVTLVSLIFLVEESLLVRLRWSAGQECCSHREAGRVILRHFKVKNWMSMGIKVTSFSGNRFVHTGSREVY